MAKSKLSARVDSNTKEKANEIFQKLGMNLSTAVNVYLHSVVINQGIPFLLTLEKADIVGNDVARFENASKEFIAEETAETCADGHPVALYDAELKKAYLAYPNGRRDYDFAKEDNMTESFRASVNEAILVSKMRGNPVARWDIDAQKPYMEYPDGHREY